MPTSREPFDKVHGTWVAYGLGNFIAQQETSIPDTYRGITARFELTETRAGGFRVSDVAYLPTMITPYVSGDPRMRVLDAAAALHDPSTPDASAAVAAARGRRGHGGGRAARRRQARPAPVAVLGALTRWTVLDRVAPC